MIAEDQLPERFRRIINEENENFNTEKIIESVSKIPDTEAIPIENPNRWVKIPSVICVYVDMKNSTLLSAQPIGQAVVGPYRLFTATAVRLFARFDAPYVDVRGDGAFALFDRSQAHRALCSAVTFKTFAGNEFEPRVKEKYEVEVGSHLGIDCRPVFVRKIGLKRHGGRTDRQNEVWAGKPVNMAAKLASRSAHNEIWASSRYHRLLTDQRALKSCGCPDGEKINLWEEVDVEDDTRFDFKTARILRSNWCERHGRNFCEALLAADES